MERVYLCIDLKTFYASVECVERNLDPFDTNLVVADESRGKTTICLAVSPKLKNLGVKNRCRLFEIPENIQYIIAKPRMRLYMEYSKNIYKIYLKYFAKEDIFVYSIDECFLDITDYTMLYKKTPEELALEIMEDIYVTTRISSACGIGSNLFLAKVALDILAKHSENHIGYLNEMLFRQTIWFHTPITDIWNIHTQTAKRLEKYRAYSLYAVAHLKEEVLKKEFGANAVYLIDHSWGMEPCTIEDIHLYKPKNRTISSRQILWEEYEYEEAFLVLKEMVQVHVLNLVAKKLVCGRIYLSIGYADRTIKKTGGSVSLKEYTNSYRRIVEYFTNVFFRSTHKNIPIRVIGIGFGKLIDETYRTVDLFTDLFFEKKEQNLQKTILFLQRKYGKNAILKGMDLEEKATTKKRNRLIGGHNAE